MGKMKVLITGPVASGKTTLTNRIKKMMEIDGMGVDVFDICPMEADEIGLGKIIQKLEDK